MPFKGTKQTGVIMPEDPNANEDSEVFQITTQCIKSLLQQPSVSRFHPCLFCLKETSVKTQSHRVTRLLLLMFFFFSYIYIYNQHFFPKILDHSCPANMNYLLPENDLNMT